MKRQKQHQSAKKLLYPHKREEITIHKIAKKPNCPNKSKSNEHFPKFQYITHKKLKNGKIKQQKQQQNWRNTQSRQQYRINQNCKPSAKRESRPDSTQQKINMNNKEKPNVIKKNKEKNTSTNKNEYDLKQRSKKRYEIIKKSNPKILNRLKNNIQKQQQTVSNDVKSEQATPFSKSLRHQMLTPPSASNKMLQNLKQKLRKFSNQSWGKIPKKLQHPDQLCQSEIQPTKPSFIRFDKFAFRSQKYIKFNEQLKLQRQQFHSKHSENNINVCNQYKRKSRAAFKRRVSNLNRDIQLYRDEFSKSEKALKNLQVLYLKEQKQFKDKKQAYIQQIQKLKESIQQQKKPIGHNFTFKQFSDQKLIPESVIVQNFQEAQSILQNKNISKGKRQQQVKELGQYLVNYYLNVKIEDEQSQKLQQICLSLDSKRDSQQN